MLETINCYGWVVGTGACIISIGLGSSVMALYHKAISDRMQLATVPELTPDKPGAFASQHARLGESEGHARTRWQA